MRFSFLVAVFTAALATASPMSVGSRDAGMSLRKRGHCFDAGANWGGTDYERAINLAHKVCKTKFKGNYKPDEARVKCYNLSSLKKVDFSLKRISDDTETRNIQHDECFDGLRKEIECHNGGRQGYENWEYTSDPNDGQCAGTDYDDDDDDEGVCPA